MRKIDDLTRGAASNCTLLQSKIYAKHDQLQQQKCFASEFRCAVYVYIYLRCTYMASNMLQSLCPRASQINAFHDKNPMPFIFQARYKIIESKK